MEIKILQVFYGKDGLPYKDKDRQVHFPIAGTGFVGASNTTKIKFYYDELDDTNQTTWVAVSKLPNGKLGSKVLENNLDDELNEHYALLELSEYYTQYKGDVYISLQGYQGGVNLDFDEETQQYEIHGTPTIAATGSIKFTNNYAPQFIGSGQTENINFQRILADLGTKLGIRDESEHVEELPAVGNPNIFYVVNDDPNNPNKQNIYIWNDVTQHYIWVGDNTLILENYYTVQQVDSRLSNLQTEISKVAQGGPKGSYATVSDLEDANPNHAYIYLVLADSKWYYWDGTNWTAGGTYLTANLPDYTKKVNVAPIYDSNNTYNLDDMVYYEENLYICLENGVTGEWDSTKWQWTQVNGRWSFKNQIHIKNSAADYDWGLSSNSTNQLVLTRVNKTTGSRTSNLYFDDQTFAPVTDNYGNLGKTNQRFKYLYLSGGLGNGNDYYVDIYDIAPKHTIAPIYNGANTYNFGDLAFHNNQLYKETDVSTTGGWSSGKWEQTTFETYVKEQITKVEEDDELFTEDLFSIALFNTGKYIANNGLEYSGNNNYFLTDFIFIRKGTTVHFSLHASTSINVFGAYNLDKTGIGSSYVNPATWGALTTGTYTATKDCYVRLCGLATDQYLADSYIYFSGNKQKYQVTLNKENIEYNKSTNASILELPNYYFDDGYIVNKLISIQAKDKITPISFALITDMHWVMNQKHSPALLSLVSEYSKVNFLVNLGDIINGGTTTATNLEYLSTVLGNTKKYYGNKSYYAKGNHDNGQEWDAQNNQWTTPTVSDAQLKFLTNNTNKCVFNPDDEFAYYIDDTKNKIRYYFLNTGLSGSSDDSSWFYSTLKTMPDGYYVGVFMHIYFYPSTGTVPQYESHAHLYAKILDALNNKTSWTNDGITYDFTDQNAIVLFIMSGHIHADYEIASDSGYPIIATTCDTLNDQTDHYSSLPPVTRTAGTYTEQAFDVVHIDKGNRKIKITRIGGGSDREFSF